MVRLEAVSSIPVSSLVHQATRSRESQLQASSGVRELDAQLRLVNVGRDELVVAVEEANADDGQSNVDTRSQSSRLGQRSLSSLHRSILTPLISLSSSR